MSNNEMLAIVSLFGGFLGFVGFIISCICVALVAGFLRSTHTVQYVPHDNTPAFEPELDVLAENEKALLDKVGKKKKEQPTVVEDLDSTIHEIAKSEINF